MYYKYAPDLNEEIKYGGLVFLKNRKLISGLFFYKQHMSIEFSDGANLSDPNSILEGKGAYRRHIKIVSPEDIVSKNIEYYIRETLANV